MKIAINGSMLDHEPTGTGIFAYNMINSYIKLNKKNNEIIVFTSNNTFFDKDINVKKISKYVQTSRYKRFGSTFRFFWNQLIFPFYAKKYDIVFNPTTHGSIFLKNQVLTILDLLSIRYGNIHLKQKLYFKYFLPLLLSRSQCIITISKASKKDIIDFLNISPDKIYIIYCGYDAKLYMPMPTGDSYIAKEFLIKDYIFAVGPTYKHKNFERLIEAYSMLDHKIKQDYKLVIGGGSIKYIEELKKGINQEDTNNVNFLGYIPIEFMPNIYNNAKTLVYPSLFEGFGLPPLEAMACGCPVIVSNTSSLPEVCGEAALYIDPLSTTEISSAILKMITDKDFSQSLIDKGLQQAEYFSWNKAANELQEVLEKEFLM